MSDLRGFQAAFAAYLCGVTDVPPGMSDRATIHRNNVRLSLTAALAANFPVTQVLVGDAYFAQAARRFIRDHLPERPDLADYGAEFPAFLTVLPELAAYPFIPDVARAERAMVEALLAPAAPVLAADAFALIPADRFTDLCFVAHPATRLVRSLHPIADLWAAHRAETPDLSGLDPHRAQAMLIVRPGETVEWRTLEAAETAFVSALLSGWSIGEAAEPLPGGFDLAEALLRLLQAGVFTGLTLSAPD